MIRRLFPAPLLSLALLAIWLVLNRDYSLGQVLLGALVATLVPQMTQSLRPTPVRIRHLGVAFRLFMQVGWDVIVWNWRVLLGTLATRERLPRGGFITVPLDLRDPSGLAVLVHSKTAQQPEGRQLKVYSSQIAGQYRIVRTEGEPCPAALNCPQANVRYRYDDHGRLVEQTELRRQADGLHAGFGPAPGG